MADEGAGNPERAGLAWQIGIWDGMAGVYLGEIDRRFTPVVDGVLRRAGLAPGKRVLDLGTGTGSVALRAAPLVAPDGQVLGVDPSPAMVRVAEQRAAALGLPNLHLREGVAEALPADDATFDVALASLSAMYVLDRTAAARELARVLRPGGRFVAAVWAGPDGCDIVRFQQTAGSFAPPPPVPGVGPGALADPAPWLAQLAEAGITAQVETEPLGFDFDNFEAAWDVLAGVTAASLSPERREAAKLAARQALGWLDPTAPRHFRNLTQFIVGTRRAG